MAGPENPIQLKEVVEGAWKTTDILFFRIGASVPLKPSDSRYDIDDPPKQPLAISEQFGLVFTVHSEGFYVTKMKSVIKLAKEIKEIVEMEKEKKVVTVQKGQTIQEVSINDVRIGKVSILALSTDSSILAATSGSEIHLFSVPSLANQSQCPILSLPSGKSSSIRDLQWCKNKEKFFVALLKCGSLLWGNVSGELKEVLQNVDAVDWSREGHQLAVAQNTTLTILSEKFESQDVMTFLFLSDGDNADFECRMKVDSLKWTTCSRIVVGCLTLDENGLESDYLIQVITTVAGKFQASSKLVVFSFKEIFTSMDDQISGGGPFLLAKYLERWNISIIANTRNMDDHIVLLGMNEDIERKQPMALELGEELYTPRIELQENGMENFILGLDADKLSLYEKVSLVKEEGIVELTPYCILACLTIEGKIVLFHVTRTSDPPTALPVSREVDTCNLDRGNSSGTLSTSIESPMASPNLKKDNHISSTVNMNQEKQISFALDQKKVKESFGFSNAGVKKDPDIRKVFGVQRSLFLEDNHPQRSPQTLKSSFELSGHLYNVNDMVKEFDMLLMALAEEGGLADSCTVYLKDSVLTLENGLANLSEKYKACKGALIEKLANVQLLQDKMVQVSARERYMEGVVMQAANSQYWDVWSRQKLGPEFLLKQKAILELNQLLRNQLFELERHFNVLELNKFGGNTRISKGSRAMSTSALSSRIQSVNRIHNTVVSQLSVAEQLSNCLTEQMATLKIALPSEKQPNVARNLLESIGLACHAVPFESSDVKGKCISSIISARNPLSPSHNSVQETTKKTKSILSKGFERESCRRTRDSLDGRLASFTPQKTIVKRFSRQQLSETRSDHFHRATGEPFNNETMGGVGLQKAGKFSTPTASQPSIIYKSEAINMQPDRDSGVFSKQISGGFVSKLELQVPQITQSEVELKSWKATEQVLQTSNMVSSPSVPVSSGKTQIIALEGSKPANMSFLNSPVTSTSPVLQASSADAEKRPFIDETTKKSSMSVMKTNMKSFDTGGNHHAGIWGNIPDGRASMSSTSTETIMSNDVTAPKPEIFSSPSSNDKGNNQKTDAHMEKNVSVSVSIPPQALGTNAPSNVGSAIPQSTFLTTIPTQIHASSMVFERFSNTSDVSIDAKLPPTSVSPTLPLLPPSSIVSNPNAFLSSHLPSLPSTESKSVQSSISNPTISSSLVSEPITALMTSAKQFGSVSAQPTSTSVSTSLSTAASSTTIESTVALSVSSNTVKDKEDNLDLNNLSEDEMEEEASDTSSILNLGGFGGFDLGSASAANAAPKTNPFRGSLGFSASSLVSASAPPGQLFRPPSFSIPSMHQVQTSQQPISSGMSSGFGQPAQLGTGPRALGLVLGSFGQSRQIGSGPGIGFGSGVFGETSTTPAAGSGFSPAGFAGAATGGNFAGVASAGTGGGSAAFGSGGGGGSVGATAVGFASKGSSMGGFSGVASEGGFGIFGSAAPSGGAFGGGGFASVSAANKPPPELLTKMRK